jgi:nucleotide-binding universal stress UspA family protein
MSKTTAVKIPIIKTILHPSDFSPASETAFVHALKISLISKAALTLLHVSPDMERNWVDFPGVRKTLERWGIVAKNSPKTAIPKLGIQVDKVIAHHKDPVKTVLGYVTRHSTDFIVLATHQDKGHVRWLHQSVSKPIARKSRTSTLFIPQGVKGFVSKTDGSVSLTRILIPIAHTPRAQPAIQAAVRAAYQLNCPNGVFTLLHVGDSETMPITRCPKVPGWQWEKVIEKKNVLESILETAKKVKADLIVMSTEGRNGFLEALRGSQTEQVVGQAPCPVLAVPAVGWIPSLLDKES